MDGSTRRVGKGRGNQVVSCSIAFDFISWARNNRAMGRPPLSEDSPTVHIRLKMPLDLAKAIDDAAGRRGKRSAFMRTALIEAVRRHPQRRRLRSRAELAVASAVQRVEVAKATGEGLEEAKNELTALEEIRQFLAGTHAAVRQYSDREAEE